MAALIPHHFGLSSRSGTTCLVPLARVDDRAGLLDIHFPAIGFRIGKAP